MRRERAKPPSSTRSRASVPSCRTCRGKGEMVQLILKLISTTRDMLEILDGTQPIPRHHTFLLHHPGLSALSPPPIGCFCHHPRCSCRTCRGEGELIKLINTTQDMLEVLNET